MKWLNKGNELKELGEQIASYKGNYGIWGIARAGEESYLRLQDHVEISCFFDTFPEKETFFHLPVCAPKFLGDFSGKLIIASSHYEEIKDQLEDNDYIENKDFFYWKTFISLYYFYKLNQLTLNRVDISVTNRCTLRCKYCNMFMPHFKNPQEQDFDEVIASIENLFRHVDYVSSIKLLGGEPFLYKRLADIVTTIGKKYRAQYGFIELFTNGTIVPTEKQLELFQSENVRIQVTDYTRGVDYRKKLDQVIGCLEAYEIRHTFYSLEQWLDFGFPHNSDKTRTKQGLMEKFDRCAPDFRGLVENRLYFCHLSASAEKANLFKGLVSDYFLLEEGMNPAELLEFDLGYNTLGYVSFCAMCRGCNSDIYVDGSAQLERG